MAFRMNRPVIKGTANHKASIAKAKAEPVVSQSRTKGDASLVGAAADLGKSYIPAAIDYSIDQKGIEFLDIKKEGKTKKRRGKTDYGTYDQYVKDHEKEKSKMSKEDKSIYGEPLSKKDWTDLNVEAGMKRPKVKKEKGKNIKEAKTTASTNYTVNKRDLVLKGGNWVPKEGAVSKEDDHAIWDGKQWTDNPKYMDKAIIRPFGDEDVTNKKKKGQVYELGSIKTEGVGNKQIRQYTEEQKERLNTEGEGRAWSNDLEKYVLSEEIVDGKFVSKAEGRKLDIYDKSKDVKTEPVVEEKKTLSNLEIRKKKMADKKYNNPNTSQYIKDQMIKEGYVPNESKSPMNMRDNRIYRNAIKGGVVQQNMIKSGYIPE